MAPSQPEKHVKARPDYRKDQITRYMRRHYGSALFVNGPEQVSLNIEELAGLSSKEICDGFNEARRLGANQ